MRATFLRREILAWIGIALSYCPVLAADPFLSEIQRIESQGYQLKERASSRIHGTQLSVLVFEQKEDGTGILNVYLVEKGRVKLIYLEPSSAMRLTLSSVHDSGRIPDLVKDGSRIIAYIATFPGLGQQSMTLLRYFRKHIQPISSPLPFAHFEDIDGDGRLEIVSRSRPLGQFFLLGCEDFQTMATSAFRTTLYGLRGSQLTPISAKHPEYFKTHIISLRKELEANNPLVTKHYAEYLGAALSIYFDYAELGQARQGWRHFRGLFPIGQNVPDRAKQCLQEMEDKLKERLQIPEQW